ncbi:E3 ubiquitin-protein ligase TRIM7-like [Paroedura picta]|uniref:E3 ubiquitin-protein ligase TRIM7-like n=1 Tax=Paroedura picta TaxID=143630 RepID=UPI004055D289
MATGGAFKGLCEEATCSICLDFFTDPVMTAECDHSFCRPCLAQIYGESGAEASCPQCRGRIQLNNLRPNRQLANFVKLIEDLSPEEGMEAKGKGREGKGQFCKKHQEPLRFFCKEDEAPLCVVCSRSKEHQGHHVTPLEEDAGEKKAAVAAPKGRVCQKHQDLMKLFCKDDEALICVVCDRSKEHRGHETLPLEEASQEYKDQLCNYLEVLKKERERILANKGDIEKESRDLLEQTTGDKQKIVAKFRQLHEFLDKKEKLLLAQLEKMEKNVAKNRDRHLAKLSEALSTVESLIREMEEKSQQSASELLQDVRSTLQRFEETEMLTNPLTFHLELKWRIWDFCDINHFLEGVRKQLKETLDSGLPLQKAKVLLDPDTAHPILILSEDQKSVRLGEAAQAPPNNPERLELFGAVLGREGFRAGRHFWEVLVESDEKWTVGVARKSVRKKRVFPFGPEGGFWAVGQWGSNYMAFEEFHDHLLALNGELKRVRVCLNCSGGRVAFFDADRGTLVYEFSGASFRGKTLLPFFLVFSKGQLKISS